MADFDDWEMLLPDAEELEEIGQGSVAADAEGLMMLRLDYFSVDSGTGDTSELSVGGRSVASDNPPHGWIDPEESVAAVFRRTDSGELWPDSGSDPSKMSDCGEKVGLGFVQSGGDDHEFEVEENLGQSGYELGYESSAGVEIEGLREVEKKSVVSDDSVEKMDIANFPNGQVINEAAMDVEREDSFVEAAEDGEIGKEVERTDQVEKKAVIWWKVPLELVKFCVFRVNPLWSVSVAAAMVGVFLMRRRLQNMKRKTKSLQIKVTVDHKVHLDIVGL